MSDDREELFWSGDWHVPPEWFRLQWSAGGTRTYLSTDGRTRLYVYGDGTWRSIRRDGDRETSKFSDGRELTLHVQRGRAIDVPPPAGVLEQVLARWASR